MNSGAPHLGGEATPATNTKGQTTYVDAIREGLREEMQRDERVFLIGEDIGVYGGAFKVTDGLVSEFGESWPVAVPVQVHGMEAVPSFAGEGDVDAARELVAAAPEEAELVLYPGDRHLFTVPSLPSYEPEAAPLVLERVVRFLDGIR